MEKHFRVGLCSGRTFTTAVHNKASHDCPLAEQQKQKAYSFTLNGKMFRSGPERYLKNCSAE